MSPAFAAALIAACSGGQPSAADSRAQPQAARSCEVGQPACADGTTCTDFGVFGGHLCAPSCASDADCADGFACVSAADRRICAPPQFAGPNGAYPDLVCYDMSVCDVAWGADQQGCTAYLDTCLNGLSPEQRDEWQRAVEACLRAQTTCAGVFASGSGGCYAHVPWC